MKIKSSQNSQTQQYSKLTEKLYSGPPWQSALDEIGYEHVRVVVKTPWWSGNHQIDVYTLRFVRRAARALCIDEIRRNLKFHHEHPFDSNKAFEDWMAKFGGPWVSSEGKRIYVTPNFLVPGSEPIYDGHNYRQRTGDERSDAIDAVNPAVMGHGLLRYIANMFDSHRWRRPQLSWESIKCCPWSASDVREKSGSHQMYQWRGYYPQRPVPQSRLDLGLDKKTVDWILDTSLDRVNKILENYQRIIGSKHKEVEAAQCEQMWIENQRKLLGPAPCIGIPKRRPNYHF